MCSRRRTHELLEGNKARHGIAGQAKEGCIAQAPEREGLGRLHRHLPEIDITEFASTALTRSYSPIDTPPDVTTTSASMAPCCRVLVSIFSSSGMLVQDQSPRRRARAPGDEHWTVRIPNLAGSESGAVDRHQLVAGRGHCHPRSASHLHRGLADVGEHADVSRPSDEPPTRPRRARLDIAAGRPAPMSPSATPTVMVTNRPSWLVSSTRTTASAPSGIGAPVMILIAVPRST